MMGVSNNKRLLFGLMYMVWATISLSGCGSSDGTTVPFSAMDSPDGTGTAARFNAPANAVVAGMNLYVADYGNHTIRKINLSSGQVTTFAGSNGTSGSTDGTGSAARFNKPFGITSDGSNLFVADAGNHTIRKISLITKAVTTLAGTAGTKGSVDKTGQDARFNTPAGIITDDGTNLYVADSGNNSIRKVVVATRSVRTLGMSTNNGNSSFLFSAMTSAGTGSAAKFNRPYSVATDRSNLYVSNTGNNAIFRLALTSGTITPLGSGNTNNNSSSVLFSAMTSAKWNGSTQFKPVYGLATDGTNLYLADPENNAIRKLVLATDRVTLLAGSTDSASGSADGSGTAAKFNVPVGVTIDSGTSLYVADNKNNTIRKIDIATGAVTTIAGKAP